MSSKIGEEIRNQGENEVLIMMKATPLQTGYTPV